MTPLEEKNAGMWAHLSGLSALVSAGLGGWIGPLVVYLMYKDRSAFVKQEAREALNFQIFMSILGIAFVILGVLTSIIGIGFFFMSFFWLPGIVGLIFAIIGGVHVNGGGAYRYPFNWRMIK